MMNVRRYLWLVAVALMGALAGCLGGSGSSGFDITENAAIEQALETQACQDFEGLMICPADTSPPATPTPTPPPDVTPPMTGTPALPSNTPAADTRTPTSVASPTITVPPTATPTPLSAPPMRIETSLLESNEVVCIDTDGGSCSFAFAFVAVGFPPGTIYRTASRTADDRPWSLSEPTAVPDSRPDHSSFVDGVQTDAPSQAPSGDEATVQIAVLVFLHDPGALPSSVSLLGETGADFAYVLPPAPVSSVNP